MLVHLAYRTISRTALIKDDQCGMRQKGVEEMKSVIRTFGEHAELRKLMKIGSLKPASEDSFYLSRIRNKMITAV